MHRLHFEKHLERRRSRLFDPLDPALAVERIVAHFAVAGVQAVEEEAGRYDPSSMSAILMKFVVGRRRRRGVPRAPCELGMANCGLCGDRTVPSLDRCPDVVR